MSHPVRILVVNPNSSQSMTDSLRQPIEDLGYNNTSYTFFTGPSLSSSTSPHSPSSIDSPADALASAHACLPHIIPLLPSHDAVLIACYSPHPLVTLLKPRTRIPITGILEASTLTALALLRNRVETDDLFFAEATVTESATEPSSSSLPAPSEVVEQGHENERGGTKPQTQKNNTERFGVVSTADSWKRPLEEYIRGPVLGGEVAAARFFAGVETCGLSAGQLHKAPQQEVQSRVKDAARRLLCESGEEGRDGPAGGNGGRAGGKGPVGVLVLGCAGMVGMEEWVRDVGGQDVRVVDGVRAGVGLLQGLVRGRF